jgi:uncharacterized protein
MYWMLTYSYVDDYMQRRTPLRPHHLARVEAAHDRGELLIAGALFDGVDGPATGAAFVFRGDTAAAAEAFVAADPYVREGLVPDWNVRHWSVVVGLTDPS